MYAFISAEGPNPTPANVGRDFSPRPHVRKEANAPGSSQCPNTPRAMKRRSREDFMRIGPARFSQERTRPIICPTDPETEL